MMYIQGASGLLVYALVDDRRARKQYKSAWKPCPLFNTFTTDVAFSQHY